MNCSTLDLNGTKAIICGGRGVKQRCKECQKPATKLCDFPVADHPNRRQKITCDAPLCDDHATSGVTPGVDFCDFHFPIAEAAYKRRQQKERAA